ncbi:MAG: hypothetical protein IKU39_00420 [Lachnospiraceae bacterium]|nr:hypothetical protein [Lachnospiraceae bacterium]
MRKIFKDDDSIEKVVGGIFGLIAIIAIIYEMYIGGFDKSAITGGIKDIAGTLITIVMLFVAINALKPKKKKQEDFDSVMDEEMKQIINKYNPIISFWGKETYKGKEMSRYNIANKLDAISTNDPGGNNKLFRIAKDVNEIEFSVSETVFPTRREAVASRISSKLALAHSEFISDVKTNQTGFVLTFKEPLATGDNAKSVAEIIDHALLLYVAEFKK